MGRNQKRRNKIQKVKSKHEQCRKVKIRNHCKISQGCENSQPLRNCQGALIHSTVVVLLPVFDFQL